jgi:hypothetical protein
MHRVNYFRQIYAGRFRVFLIIKQVGGLINSLGFRLKNRATRTDYPIWTGKTVYNKILSEYEILDMGEITLPVSHSNFESTADLQGLVWGQPGVDNEDAFSLYYDFYGFQGSLDDIQLTVMGFYLMPIDEMFTEVFWPGPGPGATYDGNVIQDYTRGSFVIDSVSPQKFPVRAHVNDDFLIDYSQYPDSSGAPRYFLTAISTGRLAIRPNKITRLYFLMMKYDATSGAWLFDDEPLMYLKVFRSSQYLHKGT